MKLKFLLSLCVSLSAFSAVAVKADIPVGTIAWTPSGANSCTWTLTSYAGGADPQYFYTLNCPGNPGIVSIRNYNNACYIISAVKAGYKATSACNTTVYKLDPAP